MQQGLYKVLLIAMNFHYNERNFRTSMLGDDRLHHVAEHDEKKNIVQKPYSW